MKERYLTKQIKDLCFSDHKMVFLSGPRQCGKTTYAKMLLAERSEGCYYNWDSLEFRRIWSQSPASLILDSWGTSSKSEVPLIVLDEIHKARKWKSTLKGLFDSASTPLDFFVSGSARLNVYKKGSDSLMGRYYNFRLHPFSLGELADTENPAPDDLLEALFAGSFNYRAQYAALQSQLLKFGGFPEPFLGQNTKKWRLWISGRIEKIVREDLRDLTRIHELSIVEALALMLPSRVGSQLSITSLREDLEVSFDSVQRWLNYFKELYYIFEIKPYSKKIPRALKRDGKIYLWDYSQVEDIGIRFENFVASHLLKACHFWTDSGEGAFDLFYVRNKEKKEIDFLITKDSKPWLPVEAKLSDVTPSPNFKCFMKELGCNKALQIIGSADYLKKHKFPEYDLIVASADRVLPYLV